MSAIGGTIFVFPIGFLIILPFSYAQAIPSRFVKDLLQAADSNKSGMLTKEEVQGVFQNTGAGDVLTEEEWEEVIDEVAQETGVSKDTTELPIETIQELMMDRLRKK